MRIIAVLALVAAWPAAQAMELHSRDLHADHPLAAAQVFEGFGCHGGNRSPQLAWSGAPAGTRSFVVTAYDPDAPTGSGWWHWVVYDLPAAATALPAGAGDASGTRLPDGALQGRNDFGSHAYGGACPPAGDAPHRYVFTVYALRTPKLDVPADASPAMIGFVVHGAMLDKASLTVRYGR